jgi:hypothetical protein
VSDGADGTVGKLLILIIRTYQVALSPMLGNCCRFYPSCSSYCIQAVERHGCLRGIILGVRRLCRCHPFNPGGVDLVPEPAPGCRGRSALPS